MSFWVPEQLDKFHFKLAASNAGCVGVPGRVAMMGGVTSAAVVTAMERCSGRQLIWSTTQFVSHAPADTDFDIEVSLLAEGRRTTQAQGILRLGGRVVLITSAALADTTPEATTQFCKPMTSTPPQLCQSKEAGPPLIAGGLMDQFERRTVMEDEFEGFEALWLRPKYNEVSTGLFAVIGDFLPGAVVTTRGSSSVDNTMRVNSVKGSEWYLAETQIQVLGSKVFQGTMNLFSEHGVLLAVASQTGIRPSG